MCRLRCFFFFSSRRRHTRCSRDWSSDVCSSDLFAEFHDAHRVRWYTVIGKHEFSDPEIAAADNSTDRKPLLVWLDESALLNVVPAADPLARLRIIKHSILAVDFM